MAFARDTRIIPRYCDNCKKQCRKIELYEPLNSKFKQLCKPCFDLWLDGKIEPQELNK